ncbi:hypothetical protein E2P81_ATG03259 [Venturia nashicola]|nr:hypothetical protein E2P81_ATG03259 [Venturia nashicola]
MGNSTQSNSSSLLVRVYEGFILWHFILTVLGLYLAIRIAGAIFTGITTPLKTIPGPAWSRFTNLPLKKAVVGGRRIFFIDELHQKYGSVVRISPNELSISDIEGFKQIHSFNARFSKNYWYDKLTIFPRHSVFTFATAKEHSARRKLFAKGFSKTTMRDHYEPVVAQKAKLAVEGIKKRALAGNADLMQWWTFLATDTVGELGFGESFGMLEKGEKTEYIRVLERALVGNGIGAELPFVRAIGRLIPTKVTREAFDATNYILQYGQRAVDNAKAMGGDSNLMANVLRESEKEDSKLDDLDVQVEATSLIFAGSGTTANTLTYLVYAVLQRPELRKQIEQEVSELPGTFNDADLENLPILNATLQETLRLYCAVPGTLPRVVPSGGVTIGGYFIPEGITVGTQAYTMHRKPDIWTNPHT